MTSHSLWNVNEICEILVQCGKKAVSCGIGADWTLKGDGSLVTAIDVENERLLKERLTALIPGSHFIGEETVLSCGETYLEEAFKGDCWVVDPIDGTSSFAHGFPTWGISVGLMRDGVLVDGCVALPALGEILVTSENDVLYASKINFNGDARIENWKALPSLKDEPFLDGGLFVLGQSFVKHDRLPLPNPVVASGSAVQAISYVLLGRAMAYIGHMKLWDIAGVLPMCDRLGLEAWTVSDGRIETDVRNGAFDLSASSASRWALKETFRLSSVNVLQSLKAKLG